MPNRFLLRHGHDGYLPERNRAKCIWDRSFVVPSPARPSTRNITVLVPANKVLGDQERLRVVFDRPTPPTTTLRDSHRGDNEIPT